MKKYELLFNKLNNGNLKEAIQVLKTLIKSGDIASSNLANSIISQYSILEKNKILRLISSKEIYKEESILINKIIELVSVKPSKNQENKDLALIMKGGGIKGLAYVGALEELLKFYKFNWFVGTSAGAITALLLAADYSNSELSEILKTKNFSEFKDASLLKIIPNLILNRGFYPGDKFRIWIEQLLAKKLSSSTAVLLKDLKYRCTVYATRRGKSALVFDSVLGTTKETEAGYAARCSMSIPIFFTPQKHEGLDVFDGGSQNNYPVEQFKKLDPNIDFIGLYLGSKIFEGNKRKNMLMEYITIWQESSDIEALRQYADETIIIDPSPISTLQFSLTPNEKEFLLENGRISAVEFLVKKKIIILNKKQKENYIERLNKIDRKRKNLRKERVDKKIKLIIWILLILSLLIRINQLFS